jgi:hypothetical protein
MEEDIRRWKDLPFSWIGRCNSENSHITKGNLIKHIQHNPYQNSNDILHSNRKIHIETQKTSKSQSNSEQNVQNWRH